MPEYKVVIKKSVEKDIAGLPLSIIKKIYGELSSLAQNPYPIGIKKLSGFDNLYRLRIGDYRIIYSIENEVLTIRILKVGHRKDVYKF